MKRIALAVAATAALVLLSAATLPQDPIIGRIEYLEGKVELVRGGKILGEPDIDEPILSGDFVETGSDGLLVLTLDKATGMSGSLSLRARTALYFKLDSIKGEARTSLDLIAGSIGSKLKKLAGSPTMRVSTDGAVMGVRGTEYEVVTALSEAVLVTCAEGEVAVSDGKEEYAVSAGKALEKRPGERFRYLPVAVSSIRDFRERWVAEEIEAFRANPLRALAALETRYTELGTRFARAFEPMQKSAVLRKWMEEDRSGSRLNPLDPQTLRDKKEIAGQLLELRKILFVYERVYYRLAEVSDLLAGTPFEGQELRRGLKAGDFLRRFRDEREGLARRVFLFRYAERLYELRNQGGAGLPGQESGDDFFGDDADFFGGSDF